MTSASVGPSGPGAGAGGHTAPDVLARFAAGAVDALVAWSVEAHLTACARCRSALSAHVDAGRLARNRSVLLIRTAIGEGGRARRLLRACGVPDHLVCLLAATPSLRRSWLLSVVGVLAVVSGEAAGVRHGWGGYAWGGYGWGGAAGLAGLGRYPSQELLVPFLLVAPLLVLAGVAGAFLPMLDPACRLAVAAPFSGFTLLLVRAVSALTAALVPVVCAALVVPGPWWLPAALLLPSLALCALALAAATVIGPGAAAAGSGALWALPVLLLAVTHLPLEIVQWPAQAACAAVILACAVVLLARHDRFELGWMR